MRHQDILTAKEIAQLIYKEIHDELTKAERLQLNQWRWAQDETDFRFLEDMTEGPQLAKDLLVFASFDSNMALKDVQRRIAESDMTSSRPAAHYLIKIMVILGAILVICGGILYFRHHHKI